MRPFRRRFRRHFLLGLLACAVLFCIVRLAPWRLRIGSATSQPRGVEAAKRAEASLLFASLSLRHARGTSLHAAPPEEGQGTWGAGWKLRESATRAAGAAETKDFPGDFSAANCTMGRCFDAGRCRGDFRVYVYPDNDGVKVSGLYRKIMRILRNSQYYTSDPDEACVLVPSWDTLDRDKLSDEYVMKLPSTWLLSHWNRGRNHLFFNLYSGSWPTYSESLDFDPGLAIVAKASFDTASFRQNFDISLPLLHNSHSERGVFPSVMTTRGNLLPIKRRYHLAFKGKRYLYGLGVEPRRSLYHIHNSRDVVMVMTCRHNKNWEKYKDSRCDLDNAEYNRFDYADLLTNSSFCLVPRGRRLGSFRFIESLQSSCIPVSLSNGYILPLDEVIDWRRYSIVVDERHFLQVPHITRSLSTQQVLDMRLWGSWVYETYFSSVEKVVMATIEIIRNRLRPSSGFVWNRQPGGLTFVPSFSPSLSDYPFYRHGNVSHSANYTIVMSVSNAALKGSSPVIKLIRSLSIAPHLSKIIIIWTGTGPPKIRPPPLPVTVTIISRPSVRINPLSRFHSVPGIETDAVLHLSEDIGLTVDEAEFGMEVWRAFPDRLVGFVGHAHSWDEESLRWSYSSDAENEYSIILSDAVFFHRYYSHALANSLPQTLSRIASTEHDCTNLILNFYVAHVTQKPPIKATHRLKLHQKMTADDDDDAEKATRFDRLQVPCLNMLVTAFGYMPLTNSSVRFDPVLFKDSVSMLRKQYRNLDVLS